MENNDASEEKDADANRKPLGWRDLPGVVNLKDFAQMVGTEVEQIGTSLRISLESLFRLPFGPIKGLFLTFNPGPFLPIKGLFVSTLLYIVVCPISLSGRYRRPSVRRLFGSMAELGKREEESLPGTFSPFRDLIIC